MAFQVSPGVLVTEKDLSLVIPQVAASVGGTAGLFRWGPAEQPTTITNEGELATIFGRPVGVNDFVLRSFLTAANFLSYSNNMIVVRALPATAYNANTEGALTGTTVPSSAYDGGVAAETAVQIKNDEDYVNNFINEPAGLTAAFAGKYAGSIANGLTVSVADADTFQITEADAITFAEPATGAASAIVNVTTSTTSSTSVTISTAVTNLSLVAGDLVYVANANSAHTGITYLGKVASYAGTTIVLESAAAVALTTATRALYRVRKTITGTSLNTKVVPNSTRILVGSRDVGTASAVTSTTITLNTDIATNLTTTQIAGSNEDGDIVSGVTYRWAYYDEFVTGPGTSEYAERLGIPALKDEMHVVVIDTEGKFTNVRGTVLEKFSNLSKLSDAVRADGESLYYKTNINRVSSYVWVVRHLDDLLATAYLNTSSAASWGASAGTGGLGSNTVMKTMKVPYHRVMSAGADGFDATTSAHTTSVISALQSAYDKFGNTEDIDVGLIAVGEVDSTVAKYVIQNIAEVRRDAIAFVSVVQDTGTTLTIGTKSTDVDNLVSYRTASSNSVNVSSSYGVMDSGYKYQYDKYNDRYVYVPLNGDVAGLCARTDFQADPWFSPGGFNRGQIKNVVKLAYNPSQADRDTFYKNNINPVTTFPGQGTVLFGDKTMLSRPSAFDRINVRRLFIILEKAISTAAKFQLFELNDNFTRAQFRNLVEPFLRDVQGRRGITDFRVVCDETNNTAEVIDRNEFVADIFVKPSRSINFIQLNFVAARNAVNFDELGA
jgi:phage tail sheath protein FI